MADEAAGAPVIKKPVRKRDSVATRARILNVATREFANKGFEGARTDDIADRARINKRMIYHYFTSKEQLYLAVLEEAYERARSAEQKLEFDQLEPLAALIRFVEFTFDSFVRDRTFINLLGTENRQRARVLKKSAQVNTMNSPIIEALAGILKRGEKAGVIRPGLDALQLWITLTGVCYFFFSNIYTLSVIFERDFEQAAVIAERRAHVVDFVMHAVKA
ncbi:TetR family transcriptional regulator [Phreatobacter aquaticus]|uniref:TetR family transcriptional regulator n=1 Tax=Phreatobacter aquaticus TaxID=2570229 RepID=A0A4D7QW02_9HYPH|nr:TetR/AcrR family transcriptional regulator [Phreatobacter aquaticus]QCK88142.1 TetR family transcriptional regulator [Phreatobacter aquaticus]